MFKCSKCKEYKESSEFYNFKKERRCKPCSKAKQLLWSKLNPIHKWGLGLKKSRFWPELSAMECVAKYEELFQSQQGLCACCGKPQSAEKKRFAVDHDHKTKKVRAILCMSCNRGIGLLGEDVVHKAAEYLNRF